VLYNRTNLEYNFERPKEEGNISACRRHLHANNNTESSSDKSPHTKGHDRDFNPTRWELTPYEMALNDKVAIRTHQEADGSHSNACSSQRFPPDFVQTKAR
jgi:hypothetical protein